MTQVRTMTPEQVNRYSRHIIMPQVGSRGQRALMESKVLIVGAGGLGSPVAVYLALAGVGTLGLVDFDVVDLSNLQRQILHQTDDVGRPKVVSAQETITAYNPDVEVRVHEIRLSSENALEIMGQYDVIVSGADNFATRYLLNDAAYLLGKPLGGRQHPHLRRPGDSLYSRQGCYRCLFPTPPPPGAVPSCAEAGVLGALTGMVGSIQAVETLKLLLGIGESLASRLLLIDALSMEFRAVRIRPNPSCPLCGAEPSIHELIDYEVFCGLPTATAAD